MEKLCIDLKTQYFLNVKHCTKFPADLVTFTEEILNGKLHFLCSETTKALQNGTKKFHVEPVLLFGSFSFWNNGTRSR